MTFAFTRRQRFLQNSADVTDNIVYNLKKVSGTLPNFNTILSSAGDESGIQIEVATEWWVFYVNIRQQNQTSCVVM